MKIILLLICLLPGAMFAQSWQWVKNYGGASVDLAHGIVQDETGNLYLAGDTVQSSYKGKITKCDPNGNILWSRLLWQGHAWAITYDNAGGIYVAGDSLPRMKVAKYDTSGNKIWEISPHDGSCHSISTDHNGYVYFTGNGSLIHKYDALGNFVWSITGFPGAGNSIQTDSSGCSYITGQLGSSFNFGSTTLTPQSNDMFVAKYDPAGNCIWAKKGGSDYGLSNEIGYAVTADKQGNCYITGGVTDTAFFDSQILVCDSQDMFIAKYDMNGDLAWLNQATGSSVQEGFCISLDNQNNIIVGGQFISSISFNGVPYFGSGGHYDLFVAKFDSSGNFLNAITAGGSPWNEEARGICLTSSGSAFVTGNLYSSVSYFGTDTVANAGSWDCFLAKIDYTTGISSNEANSISVSVYPNPFSTSTTFELTGNLHFPLELVLFNSIGQQVKCEAITGNYFELYKDNLSEGIYFYSIQEQGGRPVARGKLVIQP